MPNALTISASKIESRIFTIRSLQVMLDRDLAELYGVETRTVNQAVKRNLERFPQSFMFQLNELEFGDNLKSQSVISSSHGGTRSHDRFLIIDGKDIYHLGASLKDLSKKWFAFSKIANEGLALG